MSPDGLHSLARRGIDTAHSMIASDDQDSDAKVSPIAALIFLCTILAFFVFLVTTVYTYVNLIPTLCMIESPETNAYVPVETISSGDEPPAYAEDDDGVPKPTEPDVLLIRNKPFTTSIRQTILHLRARAGYWSRFRGLGLFLIWDILRNIIIGVVSLGSMNPLAISAAAILAEVALAHVHMTWIHIVISEPSERRWYKRIPSLRQNWVKIAPVVLLWAFVTQVVHILPSMICGSWGALKQMQDPNFEPGRKHIYISATQLFMTMLVTVILFIGLAIPATVTMVRVAASMLPEEDETIVPFDRSFGGKVTPAIVGGQGKIGLVEAWKSFPWQSRKRLLILCAKVSAIVIGAWLLFTMVISAELHMLFTREQLISIMRSLHQIKKPQ